MLKYTIVKQGPEKVRQECLCEVELAEDERIVIRKLSPFGHLEVAEYVAVADAY